MSESAQEPENPYIFHNRSDPNCETNKEIQRLRNLIRVGDLVRIEPNGSNDAFKVPVWHRRYIGEVGVVIGLDCYRSDTSIYKILLGNGIVLDKVFVLDFVVIQPVLSDKQPKRSKRR